ncbi:MAG: apolipoprotein N-acyltransferase [Planctomycetes bacterium]|nr:apolipoprotein N-acyltransferase [Planctomycetota bacterium]
MRERRKEKRVGRQGGNAARGPYGPHQASRAAGGAPGPRLRRSLSALLRPYLLAILAAMLLTLAFPPMEISWLACVAPAPLLVMALRTRRPRTVFLAGWLGGLVFFILNMHWIWPITAAGCIALIPYLALYWAVFAWALRRIRAVLPVPLTVLAPVLWVPLEYLRAWLLTGLPWVFLGHTQYENIALIQISDALGAYGLSFLVMMAAGLVTDLLTVPLVVRRAAPPGRDREAAGAPEAQQGSSQPEDAGGLTPAARSHFSRVLAAMILLTVAAWAGTVAYGLWRLGQPTKRPGPVVATVQTCVPQEVKLEARLRQIQELEQRMLQEQVDLTAAALAEARRKDLQVDLVCWPETMVPGIQNQEFLEADLAARLQDRDVAETFSFAQERSRRYWQKIRDTAAGAGCPILFGAHAVHIEGAYRLPGGGYMTRGPRYNSAFLVAPGSKHFAAEHAYAKAHLVPFGEYVPFKQSWPWLHALLGGFTPYDYDYSLTPGAHDPAPFVLKYGGAEARFQVPICYEDAMPYRVREMVRSDDPARAKAVDFLVNISNDGWFNGSVELDQHLNLCVFRAVENRVPIVRSVNTGISAIIDPEGRIETVVEKGGNRRYISGQTVGRLTLDDRAAPYTRIGDAFAMACAAAAGALAATALGRTVFRRKEAGA